MIRQLLVVAATAGSLAAVAQPALAIGPWIMPNGTLWNGLELNGRNMQGVQPSGAAMSGGASLLAIELPVAQ